MAFSTEFVMGAGGDNALAGHYNGGMALGPEVTLDTAVVKQSATHQVGLNGYISGTPNTNAVGVRMFVNGEPIASALTPNNGGPISAGQMVSLQAGDVITIATVEGSTYGNPYLGPLVWTATPLLPGPVSPLSMGGAETVNPPRSEWTTLPDTLTVPSSMYAMLEFKATTTFGNTESRITLNGSPFLRLSGGSQDLSLPVWVNAGDVIGLDLYSTSFGDRSFRDWSVSLT